MRKRSALPLYCSADKGANKKKIELLMIAKNRVYKTWQSPGSGKKENQFSSDKVRSFFIFGEYYQQFNLKEHKQEGNS